MPNLRKEARGREFQVRFNLICNGNPETTVLAHIRRGNVAGAGQKPPDTCAVLACSDCHDVIDGRRKLKRGEEWLAMYMDRYILEALCRTLAIWDKEGLL